MSDPALSTLSGGVDTSNLYASIDRDNVHGLNLSVPESAKDIIKPWDEREDDEKFADSGVDDQMVIHIPFVQRVRIRSMVLKLGRGEIAPTHLRVFANHTSIIDFNDAQTVKPQMDITLLEGQSGVTEYPVRSATFANVNSLSLFFSDAVGGDSSRVYFIGFKGDVQGAIREPGKKLDIPAQNAADSSLVDKAAERSSMQTTIR